MAAAVFISSRQRSFAVFVAAWACMNLLAVPATAATEFGTNEQGVMMADKGSSKENFIDGQEDESDVRSKIAQRLKNAKFNDQAVSAMSGLLTRKNEHVEASKEKKNNYYLYGSNSANGGVLGDPNNPANSLLYPGFGNTASPSVSLVPPIEFDPLPLVPVPGSESPDGYTGPEDAPLPDPDDLPVPTPKPTCHQCATEAAKPSPPAAPPAAPPSAPAATSAPATSAPAATPAPAAPAAPAAPEAPPVDDAVKATTFPTMDPATGPSMAPSMVPSLQQPETPEGKDLPKRIQPQYFTPNVPHDHDPQPGILRPYSRKSPPYPPGSCCCGQRFATSNCTGACRDCSAADQRRFKNGSVREAPAVFMDSTGSMIAQKSDLEIVPVIIKH